MLQQTQGAVLTASFAFTEDDDEEEEEHLQPQYQDEGTVVITTIRDELHLMGIEPIDEVHLEFPDRFTVVRTFRLPFDEPNVIPTDSFEFDNRQFEIHSIQRIDTDQTHSLQHSEEISIETRTSDIIEIMNTLYAALLFDDGTYIGELHLQHDSVRTIPLESVSERRTMTDTQIFNNIAFGDISVIPRAMTRNGVTLSLIDVEWIPITQGVGHSPISISYNAIAHYEGHYARNIVPGFITTATYAGAITFFDLTPEIIYEVTFVSMIDVEEQNGNDSYIEDREDEIGMADDVVADNEEVADSRMGGGVLGIVLIALIVFAAFKLGFVSMDKLRSFIGRGNNDYDYDLLDDEENHEQQETEDNASIEAHQE